MNTCTRRVVAGLARKPRHFAAASVVALSVHLACGDSATEASVGWPEITVLPINIAPATGDYAGDVLLGPQATQPSQGKTFLDMGSFVQLSTGPRQIPNFDFYIRPTAVVVAPASGVIWQVVFHTDANDHAIMIRQGNEGFRWVELDHVSNPTVKAGDRVTAGQPVGTAGKTGDVRLGRTELQISDGNSQPVTHFCPNLAFAPSARAELEAKLSRLMQDIEARQLNPNLYNEAAMFRVGCNVERVQEAR